VPARSGGRALCAPECAGHQLRIKYRRWVASERLVFIDETWTKTNMAPLRAWAPRGGRLIAKGVEAPRRLLGSLYVLLHPSWLAARVLPYKRLIGQTRIGPDHQRLFPAVDSRLRQWRRRINDRPTFHDHCQAFGILQNLNVDKRVAIHYQYVGEFAFLDRADLILHAEREGRIGCAGSDRIHRAHAEVMHEMLHLTSVPGAIGDRRLTAIGAGYHHHAGLMCLAQNLGRGVKFTLVRFGHHGVLAKVLAPFDGIGQEAERRRAGEIFGAFAIGSALDGNAAASE
jgi:hypothetical protein